MIYKFVVSFVIINIISELVEMIFPSKFMNNFVKSMISIIFLYSLVKIILGLMGTII